MKVEKSKKLKATWKERKKDHQTQEPISDNKSSQSYIDTSKLISSF